MKRLIIDLDETVVQFLDELLKRYNYKYNQKICLNDIEDYDMSTTLNYDYKSIFMSSGFFVSLNPFPNAVNTLKKLQDNGNEIIISSDCLGEPTIAQDKLIWIRRYLHFIPRKNIMLGSRKDLLKGDIIFDDAPKFINNFDGFTVVNNRPYNQDVSADFRVYDDSWNYFNYIVENT